MVAAGICLAATRFTTATLTCMETIADNRLLRAEVAAYAATVRQPLVATVGSVQAPSAALTTEMRRAAIHLAAHPACAEAHQAVRAAVVAVGHAMAVADRMAAAVVGSGQFHHSYQFLERVS